MPDITNTRNRTVKRRHSLSPMVAVDGCLYCPHAGSDHQGQAYMVRREGRKYRKYRKYVVHAIFCRACAAAKATGQVACWQMPERVYRNFSRYGVEVPAQVD